MRKDLKYKEWQLNQAENAVKLYIGNFLRVFGAHLLFDIMEANVAPSLPRPDTGLADE